MPISIQSIQSRFNNLVRCTDLLFRMPESSFVARGWMIALIALLVLVPLNRVSAQEQVQEKQRLQVDPSAPAVRSKIEVEGLVTNIKKYSVEVTSEDLTWQINVTKDTAMALKCSSPRIDFEKSETWVGIEGSDKRFKRYKFKAPIYIQAQFNHQNHLKRIMSGPVKRFPTFVLADEAFTGTPTERQIFLNGKLEKGDTKRQLKMTTDAGDTHPVLLSKNGQWYGFSLTDLRANATRVRINGLINAEQQIDASKILFWPVKKPKAVQPRNAKLEN